MAHRAQLEFALPAAAEAELVTMVSELYVDELDDEFDDDLGHEIGHSGSK